jgi:hypothetical protein
MAVSTGFGSRAMAARSVSMWIGESRQMISEWEGIAAERIGSIGYRKEDAG